KLDAIEIVRVDDVVGVLLALASHDEPDEPWNRRRPNLLRCDEVQSELETCLRSDVERPPARVRVGIGVGDQREGDAAVSVDLDRRLVAAATAGQQLDRLPRERQVAGPAAVATAPEL